MFNPYKLYRKSQDVQYEWIRNHPVQYVALNATVGAVFFGIMKYNDRQEKLAWREHVENHEIAQQEK